MKNNSIYYMFCGSAYYVIYPIIERRLGKPFLKDKDENHRYVIGLRIVLKDKNEQE